MRSILAFKFHHTNNLLNSELLDLHIWSDSLVIESNTYVLEQSILKKLDMYYHKSIPV